MCDIRKSPVYFEGVTKGRCRGENLVPVKADMAQKALVFQRPVALFILEIGTVALAFKRNKMAHVFVEHT